MSVFTHIYDGIVQKRTYVYSKIRKRIRITQILIMHIIVYLYILTCTLTSFYIILHTWTKLRKNM